MKVIGYVRVSTEEQASHGVSLAAQEAKLRAYADLYDLELTAVIVDAGQSAKTLNRPGLNQALQALEAGEVEGLLIAKLDRLTRSVTDWGTLIERYFGKKFALLSVTDQIDTRSAAGRLGLNILMSVAQWEREAIGERTSAALQHKKAMGQKLGAPELACPAILSRIRELRLRGYALRAIANCLTEEGHKTQRGGRWQPQTVKLILDRMAG